MKEEIKGKAIETVDTVNAEGIVKFEVGKVYRHVYDFTVINRTNCFVMLTWDNGLAQKSGKFKIRVNEKGEHVYPLLSTILYAADEVKTAAEVDVEDYVVTAEAFDAAIEGEIENAKNATAENETNAPIETIENEVHKIEVKIFTGEIRRYATMDFVVHDSVIFDNRSLIGYYADAKTASAVIDELKAAYERGDKTFTMPIWTPKTIKFEVGKMYRFGSDNGAIVTKRTAKTVSFTIVKALYTKGDKHYFDGSQMMCWVANIQKNITVENYREVCSFRWDYVWGKDIEKIFADGDVVEYEADDAEITVDYNFDVEDEDDELVDPPESKESVSEPEMEMAESETAIATAAIAEVTDAPAEVSTSELEKALKNLQAKIHLNKKGGEAYKEAMGLTMKKIVDLYSEIAYYEDEIWEYFLRGEENAKKRAKLESQAAEIEAEIRNREFNAQALEAAMAAEKVAVVDSVPFDLQTFSEGGYSVIADSPATIDTAVAYTEVPVMPVIDDSAMDAAAKKLFGKVKSNNAEIEKINAQIAALEARREKLITAENQMADAVLYDFMKRTIKFGEENIVVKTPGGRKYRWGESSLEYICLELWDNDTIKISYLGEFEKPVGVYDWETFKAAIRGLGAAIARGDTEYAFPVNVAEIIIPA